DVLIGTQMVAKGLDLPRVTLVGVVSSDTSLYLPDIRSRERTFQLLSQVAGRAGRSALGGRVVFQTYTPNDPAIQRAAEHDFTGFFADEITYRMEQGYPPFRTLVRLEYLSASENAAAREAERLARSLRLRIDQLGLDETHVVGPAPAFFGRVRGKSRWHVIVASRSAHELLAEVEVPRGWRVDVDPVSVL
ncbi:MAG: primosomal protein N', partial [Anaerolineae bacterium]